MRGLRAIDTVVRTLVALLVVPLGIILCSCIAVVLALVTDSSRRVHWAYLAFARLCLLAGSTDLRTCGADHIESGPGYVIVSNHESNWDPPSVIAALPDVVIRGVVKRQITRIPIFGQALRLTGNVIVHRNRSAGDIGRIRDGMQALDPHVSIYFFAEGTRSRSGEMERFKKGAFATAIAQGLPILPIGIAGTRAIFTPNRLRLRKGRAAIEIGEPIAVAGLTLDDRTVLRDQAEEVVNKLRARAQQRLQS